MRYEGGQFYLKSPEEMYRLFKYAPQAMENTQKIADRCNVTFEFGVTKIPSFPVPEGYTSWTYLKNCAKQDFTTAILFLREKLTRTVI